MADGHELTSISSAVPAQDGNALTPTLWACGAASQVCYSFQTKETHRLWMLSYSSSRIRMWDFSLILPPFSVIICNQGTCSHRELSLQAIAARMLTKRGDGGPSMPLRAFSIASLVLGAGFCAMGGTLWASGIREVRLSIFVYKYEQVPTYLALGLCYVVENSCLQSCGS